MMNYAICGLSILAAFFWGLAVPGERAEDPFGAPIALTVVIMLLLAFKFGVKFGKWDLESERREQEYDRKNHR